MCVGRTLLIVKWILKNLTRDGFYCLAHVNTEMKRDFLHQLGNCLILRPLLCTVCLCVVRPSSWMCAENWLMFGGSQFNGYSAVTLEAVRTQWKRRWICTRLLGVTSKKTVIFRKHGKFLKCWGTTMTCIIWRFELKDKIIYMSPLDSEIPISTWDIRGVTLSTFVLTKNSAVEICVRTSFRRVRVYNQF